MNYQQLEKKMQSPITFGKSSDKEILDHFKKSFDIVPYHGDIMFVFHHQREFLNQNHIISFHPRSSGAVPMHIFHYIVITYVYSGTLVLTVEDKVIRLNQGDIIVLDRHVPHSVAPTSQNDLGINIILNDDYFMKKFINRLPNNKLMSKFIVELMNSGHPHTHYLVFNHTKETSIHNCIQNILCEYLDPQFSSSDIIDNYIMILMTYLARIEQVNTNISSSDFKNQQLLDDIMDYIHDNYCDGNLKTMCEHFGYDPSYTSKLIKRFSGKTFKQLVNEERMKRALILLQNQSMPIYDIAQEVGFNNLTSFYKKFQEFNNCTPQDYRDTNKEL